MCIYIYIYTTYEQCTDVLAAPSYISYLTHKLYDLLKIIRTIYVYMYIYIYIYIHMICLK